MTKRYGFIQNLEAEKKAPKKKYQLYEAEMGFERAKVLIPIENCKNFEAATRETPPKSTTSLSKLAIKFGGLVE